ARAPAALGVEQPPPEPGAGDGAGCAERDRRERQLTRAPQPREEAAERRAYRRADSGRRPHRESHRRSGSALCVNRRLSELLGEEGEAERKPPVAAAVAALVQLEAHEPRSRGVQRVAYGRRGQVEEVFVVPAG